jgi:hypothetical protein
MKYFKPELLARCQSLDDDVAEAAADEWDRAIDKYNEELAAIRPLLPAGVIDLIDHFALHDARIEAFGIFWPRSKFLASLIVRLEGTSVSPGPLLELAYTLPAETTWFTIPGVVTTGMDLRGLTGHNLLILYDEFNETADGPVREFSHSFLLSDGVEMQIRFTDLHIRRLKQSEMPFLDLEAAETAKAN